MYQITDIISRDTIFFFIVFLFVFTWFFCNTGSGFGYFQIKSKQKVTLASIAPHEAQGKILKGFMGGSVMGFGAILYGWVYTKGLGHGIASIILRIIQLLISK